MLAKSIIDNVVNTMKKHNVEEIYCNFLTHTPLIHESKTLDIISLNGNKVVLYCSDEVENDYFFADYIDIKLLIEFYQWFIDYEDELFTQDY